MAETVEQAETLAPHWVSVQSASMAMVETAATVVMAVMAAMARSEPVRSQPVALAEMAASRALPVSAVQSALEGRGEQLELPAFQEMAAMEATTVLASLVSTD